MVGKWGETGRVSNLWKETRGEFGFRYDGIARAISMIGHGWDPLITWEISADWAALRALERCLTALDL